MLWVAAIVEDHQTAIGDALKEIRERFGHLAVSRGASTTQIRPRPVEAPLPPWWGDRIPSGHRIVELAGPESCGKLSLALAWLAAHDRGGLIAVLDLTREFYPPSAARAGIDVERLVIVQPPGTREVLEAANLLVGCAGFDAILWPMTSFSRPNGIAASKLHQMTAVSGTRIVSLLERPHRADWWGLEAADVRIAITQHDWRWFEHEMTGVDVVVTTERMRGIMVPDWSFSLDTLTGPDQSAGFLKVVSSGAKEQAGSGVDRNDEIADPAI